jgi:serpin B
MATLKDGNLAISAVLQKTFIDVNEAGTKAAAVTAIGEAGSTATPDEPEVREVILDRPFVYFIIDNMTLTPLFAGVLTQVE